MKKEVIERIIDEYDLLCTHTHEIIKYLGSLNIAMYNTQRGVIGISFSAGEVNVEYDDSRLGIWETGYFSFPIEWLSLSKNDIWAETYLVEQERLAEIERRVLAERQAADERDRLQYEKLKLKYEK